MRKPDIHGYRRLRKRRFNYQREFAMARLSTIAIFFVSFAVAVSYAYTPCEFCLTRASDEVLASMSFRLYRGGSLSNYTTVPVANGSYLLDEMDSEKPTVFYIYGWSESPNSTSVATVLGGYFGRGDHNVCLLDYSQIADQSYPYGVFSADGVGYTVAKALNEMVARGMNSSGIHIVGHSLGGQVAGCIGRYVNFTLPRITGLDPAGPGFDELGKPLSSQDAQFVDVIHTDARFYGSNRSSGHFNSFPNGGSRIQPGCPKFRLPLSSDDYCDHHRSWYYYAESLMKEDAFMGLKCDSYSSWRRDLCASNERILVGYGTPNTARGDFYLQTNSTSPFGRGNYGLKYEASGFSISSIILSAGKPFSFGR